MSPADVAKASVVLFVAALLQITVFSTVDLLGGTPDLLLVTLVAVALLRGSLPGAIGGFLAGLMVDTASLGTLGLTSLLLSLTGYWVGRYGETTGRGRVHAPPLAVGAVTVLFAVGALGLHAVLGESAPLRLVLVDSLLPTLLLNLLLATPIFALVRMALRPPAQAPRSGEVELLG